MNNKLKSPAMKFFAPFIFTCLFCMALLVDPSINSAELETRVAENLHVLKIKGTPYELGFQHGQSLKNGIAYNVKRIVEDKIFAQKDHPQIQSFLAVLPKVLTSIPKEYLEEIKGLAEGSGVPYEKLLILNLFPEMFHCVGLTVEGEATRNGELYHVRVLDYAVGAGLQDTAVLMVVQPDGKIPFLNLSYAGFIGSITGMNAQKIALGEIGGKGYGEYEGMPMAFLLRKVLEETSNLQEVKNLLSSTPRTCEYYYVFSDGKTNQSFGVYATGKQLQFIDPGVTYAILDDHVIQPHDNKVVLTDSQIESSNYQTVLYSNAERKSIVGIIHHQPAHCLALTGFSHPQRYPILIGRLIEQYGKLGPKELQEIIKPPVTRTGNLHNAIFAPRTLEAWIAHAGPSGESASTQPYQHVNLAELLQK